jgi:hypothetical protein
VDLEIHVLPVHKAGYTGSFLIHCQTRPVHQVCH